MQAATPRVRVAIVEDDPILRADIARAVSLAADLKVVGEAQTLAEGRVLLAAGPEVLLIDLALPDGNGIDLIREAQWRTPRPKCIVITIFGDAATVVRAIEAGADGYLLKGSEPAEAAAAIRSVLEGGAPISPAVASHILARARVSMRSTERDAGDTLGPALSEKEIGILTDLAKGFRYKEVARIHGISPLTVGGHVKSIYRKLAVNSRSEAVFEAVQAGLIQLRE